MSEPRLAIACVAMVLGIVMIIIYFVTFWLGFEPAGFAVTGLVWVSILCLVGTLSVTRR